MVPWTVASETLPTMGFPRQEYWSGLPFPSPRDLPSPGIEPGSPTLQADALLSEPPGKPRISDQMAGYCVAQSSQHIKITIKAFTGLTNMIMTVFPLKSLRISARDRLETKQRETDATIKAKKSIQEEQRESINFALADQKGFHVNPSI